MARRKRLAGAAQRRAGDAASVWTGMGDWRAAHPKATFSEIEAALSPPRQARPETVIDGRLGARAWVLSGVVG